MESEREIGATAGGLVGIPLARTRECIEELRTDGHAPVKFLCDDGRLYYCKYRKKLTPEEELDCLYYELVGNELLKQLELPQPEVAFVEVVQGSFNRRDLEQNRTHLRPGVVAFGSQHLPGNLVNDFTRYPRSQALKLVRPEDLIRIALFDLWVENVDRGRPVEGGHNFNLLSVPSEGGHLLVPIDHAFILGGQQGLRTFQPAHPRPSVENKLFRTALFHDVMAHLGTDRRAAAVNRFFQTLLPGTSPHALRSTLDAARPYWPYPPNFDARLTAFLWDPERLALIEQVARSYFHQLS